MIDPLHTGRDLKILSIQCAFFWQGLDLSQPLVVAQQINDALGAVYDGEPAVLPAPQNVPQAAQMPRIILTSRDNRYKCNISPARADIVFAEHAPEPPSLMEIWDVYFKLVQNFEMFLRNTTPATVMRLGILFRLFRKLDISGNEYIRQHYLKEEKFESPYEAQLNLLHRARMDRFNINRWLRLRSLRNTQNPQDDKALMLEVDINTIQEEQHPFAVYEIIRFFETAYERLVNEDSKYLMV